MLLQIASIPRFWMMTMPTMSFAKKLSEKLTRAWLHSSEAMLRSLTAMLSFGQFFMQFAQRVQLRIESFAGIVLKKGHPAAWPLPK